MAHLKEALENTAEFESSEHLLEGSKFHVSLFLRVDLEEVVTKNGEFENSNYLKKRSKSQCSTSLFRILLCYRLQN